MVERVDGGQSPRACRRHIGPTAGIDERQGRHDIRGHTHKRLGQISAHRDSTQREAANSPGLQQIQQCQCLGFEAGVAIGHGHQHSGLTLQLLHLLPEQPLIAQLRGDVSELWERFDRVAGSNPEACFAAPHTAAELAATTEDNRLLAFPYNKWHSTQWALDHAVALVISAEEVALANGVAADQLVHPRVALDSSWGLSLTRRAEPHRWPMMRIMGEAAAEHLEADLSGIDATELYSCFPASVRVQQRELALAVEGTPTVLGGMPFAGGPFNHFTYMATAELALRLRSGESDLALISTVSGLLTKGGLMVWGREPAPSGALVADVAPEARAATLPQDLAPFDADRDLRADDTVVAATVTGGFDPRVFRIVDDQEGVRHVISRSAEAGEDPLAVLR